MDEVNAKFPMQKYKNWMAGRAAEGLPTAGGVLMPPSRSHSVQSAASVPLATGSINAERSGCAETDETAPTPDIPQVEKPQNTAATDDSDGEQIAPALPLQWRDMSGDTCAICIDTLEDDDDVRGFPCGHAFHAGCIDPWLTSRRACCPLCKADYYTPKPRHPDAPQTPRISLINRRRHWQSTAPSATTTLERLRALFGPPALVTTSPQTQASSTIPTTVAVQRPPRVLRLPTIRNPFRRDRESVSPARQNEPATVNSPHNGPTPSQLEAQ